MLEKLKQLFTLNKKKEEVIDKDIIIFIHGFGRRQEHEYDNFLLFNQDKYHFKTFKIFNIDDEDDHNPTIWIARCESMVEAYVKAGYRVSLLGFSMGGVIAAHLASMFPIEKLFLVAPAFDYLNVANVVSSALNKVMKPQDKNTSISLPSYLTSTFMEVVRLCKEDISKVTCPVCFIHGDKDETIPTRSSINAYHKIKHDKKKLFILHEGQHQLMMHPNSAWETWQIYNLFMDGHILGNQPTAYANDILAHEKITATP